MENSRRSITLKVIIGYLLVAVLAAVAIWFTYSQVVKFTRVSQSNNLGNQQLVLVSEIATELYRTESMGRRFIQSGDSTDLEQYSIQIGNIQTSIDSLRTIYADSTLKFELDSISNVLSKKTDNLEELLELRSRDRNTNYYKEVIRELQKVDPSFIGSNYDQRFSHLEPHQRRVLIQLLEFSKNEDSQQISTISADSLILAVKQVLSELERENQQFREVINQKENELLVNDMVLNEQLRNLLRVVEREERETSLARVEKSQLMLNDIFTILSIVGAACILIILLFLFLIVRDISQSQRYRIQLEEAKSFTEALMQRREQFIATITHDLRSPLNTVIGYSELMGKTGLNKKQDHYLNHLKKSSEYILHLVNDLLDLSKLEAGKMLIENLPFNPKNLLEDTLHNTIPEYNKKDLKITFDASPDADCQVISDPFRIKQILSNLITNAYKFTETGEIKASISLQKKIEDSYILIFSIKDTGIGISQSKRIEIFEEFSQEHGEIEKNMVAQALDSQLPKESPISLEGTVELESEQGKGSEFIVKIPVKKTNKPQEIIQNENLDSKGLQGKNVLVVDDESSQLALSKELLKSLGMNCDTSLNGKEAIKKLEEKEYHLVLTDIQMPVMDGFELIKAIKTNPEISKIPVIAVSGRTNVPAKTYTAAGFAGNLLKPYKPEDILLTIGQVLKVELKARNTKKRSISKGENEYSLEEISLFTGEDQQALDTIINVFVESTKTNLKEIEVAATSKDYDKIAQIAHRMLPMFKQLKAKEIIPKLEKLEKMDLAAYTTIEISSVIKDIRKLLLQLQVEVKA